MKIKIRKGKKKDIAEILKLIKELAEYEKSLFEVTITEKQLLEDGFGKNKCFQFLVAEHNKKVIGLSFYWIRYSTWKGKFLFLEDFVVSEEFRRKGVGTKLFEETIKISNKLKTNGMIWQVLEWNTPAINFYKKYKASISSQWLNGKLNKSQIDSFIALKNVKY